MRFQKILLLGAIVSLAMMPATYAQKANVRKARRNLTNAQTAKAANNLKDVYTSLKKAKTAIDAAVKDPSTKDDPKTWLTKASVYLALQGSKLLNANRPYLEGYEALKKTFELDASYKDKSEAIPVIQRIAYYAFNDGVEDFNNSNYDSSLNRLEKTLFLLGNKGDKRFDNQKKIDTIRAQAEMIAGYSAYYSNKYQKAISYLKDCAPSPYLGSNGHNVYLLLAQAYGKTNDTTQQLATIEEGLKKFPTDKNLKNAETNYYINSHNLSALLGKLEQQAAQEPDNASVLFSLGVLYDQLADAHTGKENDYSQKAEKALQKAVSLAPENPQMNYQLAAHFYNQAVTINKTMNQMTGENQTKYKALKSQRDVLFEKALPMLEKSKSIYLPNAATLKGEDRKFYAQTLQALAQIYAIQNKLDKAKADRDLLNKL